MRKRLSLYIFIMLAMMSVASCTVVRDTTPCNSSRYLALLEKPTLTTEEIAVRDSFAQRCEKYNKQEAARADEKPEGAGWLGVGLGVAVGLIVLYLSGLIF